MRTIDRLLQYLEKKKIAPYRFERQCGIANGYLKKQTRGKGGIGSDILEKIMIHFPELSLTWLILGEGPMIRSVHPRPAPVVPNGTPMVEEDSSYLNAAQQIALLKMQTSLLEKALADKEKIITMLEQKLRQAGMDGPQP